MAIYACCQVSKNALLSTCKQFIITHLPHSKEM